MDQRSEVRDQETEKAKETITKARKDENIPVEYAMLPLRGFHGTGEKENLTACPPPGRSCLICSWLKKATLIPDHCIGVDT
jgi:hypothetical protein